MTYLITHAQIVTETDVIPRGWLLTDGDRIKSFAAGDPPNFDNIVALDAGGRILAPGFIDIHVHGGNGFDTMDADEDGLCTMARYFAANGVTTFLATTWSHTKERVRTAMQAAKSLQGIINAGATMAGVHMEGPYLNITHAGAQNPQYIRRADHDEMATLFELDIIKLLALAPEFEENHWLIREAVRRGIQVSVAHSDATYDQMQVAFALGITHTTHTCNGMNSLHHREPNIQGAVLTNSAIYCELIPDTIHVHPAMMKIIWKTKGHNKTILITDSIRAAGLPDGDYPVDDRVMTVKDGACRLEDGTLAGSIVKMNDGVRHFMQATGEPFENLWQTTSLNAARAVQLSNQTGSITVGKLADLVLIDEDVNVAWTMAQGKLVYRAS